MDNFIALANGLNELHDCWQPLPWQIPLGQALFYRGIKDIGAQCGRSSGKTEVLSYNNWRWAFENPGSENYIIEPLFTQAREILWASNRIQSFGPEHWIDKLNDTECRITFTNGSFIKLEGSDRPDKLRGLKPRGVISWDEVKDCRLESINAMDPNRARYNAPVCYFGTPPEFHNHYVEIMDALKKDPKSFWCTANSFENTYNDKAWLERKRESLIAAGNEEEWLREYMAIFIVGGKRHIFPQFLKLKPEPMESRKILLKEYVLIVAFDPAATSVFGCLMALYHPYKKTVALFDEIYESDPTKMTSRKIHAVTEKKIAWLKDKVKAVRFVYDSAAAYFRSEVNEIEGCDWWLETINKNENGIEGHINIIRSVITRGLLSYTPNCEKFVFEMEGYVKDEKGRVPDKHDHLINSLSYLLVALGFNLDTIEHEKIDSDTQKRGYSLEQDMADEFGGWKMI